ncbi:MAG: methylmalonyl Co-A mutase-associated GTPase MeaB [Flavisolibacter sp.]
MWQQLLDQIQKGNVRALARGISFVENEQEGYEQLLATLPENKETELIGITGPPGAGKSTLVNALIQEIVNENKKIAVLCVDPSSPFNLGAVLGDRIRMSEWYTHPDVFIRSLATRGAMGGLHPKTIEITELVKAASFDYIIIETVGVGQSEIEIAGLADVTVVVLVPEAGDEVQTMKAGLMEIADIFVVNKSDRPDADSFIKNLRLMLAPAFRSRTAEVSIVKTVAAQGTGIAELFQKIEKQLQSNSINEKHFWLLAERAYYLIQQQRMKTVNKSELKNLIEKQVQEGSFNLYHFIQQFAAC